jgi:hypothetical protein
VAIIVRKNVNKEHVTSDDLRKYKKILLLTNAHLEGYDPAGAINDGRGKKFGEIFAHFSRGPNSGVSNWGYAVYGKNTKLTAIYYNPEKQTAFSTLDKLAAAIPRKNKSDVKLVGIPRRLYNAEACQEEVLTQSLHRDQSHGGLGVRYIRRAISLKIQ